MSTNDVANEERRRTAITEVAPRLAASAVLRDDEALAERLEAASAALEASRPDDPVVRMWAWTLRPSAMRVEVVGETQAVVIDTPDDLDAALTALSDRAQALNAADNVAMRNMYRSPTEFATDELENDVAVCRSDAWSGSGWDVARINTAAAAVRASLSGSLELSDTDVRWAIAELLNYLPTSRAGSADDGDGDGDDDDDDDDDEPSPVWRPIASLASALPLLRSTSVVHPDRFDLGDIRAQVESVTLDLTRLGGAEILWILLAERPSTWRSLCVDHSADSCPNRLVVDMCGIILDRSVRTITARPTRNPIDGEYDDEELDGTRHVRPDLLLAPLAPRRPHPSCVVMRASTGSWKPDLTSTAEAFRSLDRTPHTDGYHFPRIGQALFRLAPPTESNL